MTTQTPDAVREARRIAIKYALPGEHDGISTFATNRGDADDKPYMRAIVDALESRSSPLALIEAARSVIQTRHGAPAFSMKKALDTLDDALAALDSRAGDAGEGRCADCPPNGYPTDATRCAPCDRRATPAPAVDAQEGDDEGPCTDCGDTGITIQTERACSCEAGDEYRAPAVDAPTERQAALAKLTAMDDDGFPDEPLPISPNAVDAVPAGEVRHG